MQLQDQRNNDRELAKLEETDTYIKSLETTTRRSSSWSQEILSNVHLLPNKFIFCDKKVKYVKRKSEFFRKFVVEQANSKMLQHAKEKNDFHLILFLPPTLMSVEQVIMLFCQPEKDDYVAKTAAAAIRKVFQFLKDEMPWPP